ncbi:MAG TPA: hypothetical protein VGQ13_01205 [Nitrososphaera sp.]|nr:hypothetical protein [Nitrososphaera sp.]
MVGEQDMGTQSTINHSLRKFFKSQLRKVGVDPLLIEYLMGHKSGNVKEGVTRLMATYDPADSTELMKAYAKGVDNLIIFSANKLKVENEELRRKLNEVPTVESLQADLQKEQEKSERLYEQLYAQG